MGIVDPPAECIAAVDPAAVETLRPLDLQCSREEGGPPSFLILLVQARKSMKCSAIATSVTLVLRFGKQRNPLT